MIVGGNDFIKDEGSQLLLSEEAGARIPCTVGATACEAPFSTLDISRKPKWSCDLKF